MESSFAWRHVTCGYGQRSPIELVHKKSYEVPACFCWAESSVHVLACSVTVLDESELGSASEKFLNFIDFHVMLAGELLDDFFEPDEAGDAQRLDFASSGLSWSRISWKISLGGVPSGDESRSNFTGWRPASLHDNQGLGNGTFMDDGNVLSSQRSTPGMSFHHSRRCSGTSADQDSPTRADGITVCAYGAVSAPGPPNVRR